MADPLYTAEKLGAAVQKLAVGRGRIQERLNDALSDLVMVDENVFKADGIYREAPEFWRRIWSKLTAAKTGAPNETGAGPRSIEMMTEEEASSVAQSIVSLDSMLDSYIQDQRRKS
jgi:hypothetical protein